MKSERRRSRSPSTSSRATRPPAAPRTPRSTTELAFQRAQRAKREATDALRDGDVDRAKQIYHAASLDLRELDVSGAPAETAAEIGDEVRILEELAVQAEMDQVLARKRALADHHRKSRKRGRES